MKPKIKYIQIQNAMKTRVILNLIFWMSLICGVINATDYPKAISGNDTSLILIKRNLELNNNSFDNILNKANLMAALPDTTKDIIIIFRSSGTCSKKKTSNKDLNKYFQKADLKDQRAVGNILKG